MTISWDAVRWEFLGLIAMGLAPLSAGLLLILPDDLIGWAKAKLEKRPYSLSKDSILVMQVTGVWILFSLLLTGFLIFEARGPWEVKDQGVFHHVEYTDTRVKKVPVGYRTIHKTIIHFADGHAAVIPGERSVEFPKGTPIRVMTKNDFYKIERDD